MSYNIDTWHQKEAVGIVMPLPRLISSVENWSHVDSIEIRGTKVTINLDGEISFIECELLDGVTVQANKIECYGSFSNRVYNDTLLDAILFLFSKYEAITVWEGGDSVEKISIQDGKVVEVSLLD